jgi:two-component system C4-dicarboxylate transport response regulator DctD
MHTFVPTRGTAWLREVRTGHGDTDEAEQPVEHAARADRADRAGSTGHADLRPPARRPGTLIGSSAAMDRLRRTVQALAATDADVVIYGETGTGKDLVARCLHDHSHRRRHHFVALNCGGLPEALAETELFGHEAGAYTGATRARGGKFEHAHGGTLFLDEIESMPLAVQVKLLRALQERCVERVGSHRSIEVDCRVVAASKADLKALADQHRFRADLYYRLGVAFIELPSLRERREDIPQLFDHFTALAAQRHARPAPPLHPAQLARLMSHAWPGNVRELRNVAERFVLGLDFNDPMLPEPPQGSAQMSLPEQVEQFERTVIRGELQRLHGEVAAVARALGLPKPTLYDKLRRLGLVAEDFRSQA